MKRVYLAQDFMEAERLQEFLAELNISVHISDAHTHSLQAANPMAFPALWVEDDLDTAYVRARIREFLARESGEGKSAAPWTCRHCGESNPGNFDLCWACGVDSRESTHR